MLTETGQHLLQLFLDVASEQDPDRFDLLIREIKRLSGEVIHEAELQQSVN
jgi:hypothetical protein